MLIHIIVLYDGGNMVLIMVLISSFDFVYESLNFILFVK